MTDNEPFSFADEEGHIQGFVVDLLEGIERHMALQFDRVTGTTSEINGAFLAGRLDLLAAIQARRPDLPRLLMSGYLGPEQLARCQKAGLSGVLDKPLSVEGIARALASALGKTGRQGSQG